MKYLCIILLFFAFVYSCDNKYDDIFYESYKSAVKFIDQNEVKFTNELGTNKAIRLEKISIIFPELLKYSKYKDILETTALELIYINYGKEQADFSIGYFQMKPSFIENLEDKIIQNSYLNQKYNNLIDFKDSSIKSKRKERIARLQTLHWQLNYLNCFYDYLTNKYSKVEWKNKENKIRFFATAYNYNFTAEMKDIEKWIDQKTFPYGLVKGKQQYAYSDIAVFYFKNHE